MVTSRIRFGDTCYKCPDRTVGCHGRCEKYLAAKEDHAKRVAEYWEEKKNIDMMDSYQIAAIKRVVKKKEKGRKT